MKDTNARQIAVINQLEQEQPRRVTYAGQKMVHQAKRKRSVPGTASRAVATPCRHQHTLYYGTRHRGHHALVNILHAVHRSHTRVGATLQGMVDALQQGTADVDPSLLPRGLNTHIKRLSAPLDNVRKLLEAMQAEVENTR
jgi:hypothetical protein